MMKAGTRAAVALLCAAALSACANDPLNPKDDPDTQLQKLLEEWYTERADGDSCVSGGRLYPYTDCGRIQAAIERLALEFPTHPPILLTNAVIASETGRPDKAIDYLDALLDLGEAQPDAVVLRSRLAIESGNLPFAQRLLESHTRLTPDAPALREALASVHYLQGDHDAARRNLLIAERLGAPSWRISYHRGLVDEAEGYHESAIVHYRAALRGKPDWREPAARLRGLESQRLPGP